MSKESRKYMVWVQKGKAAAIRELTQKYAAEYESLKKTHMEAAKSEYEKAHPPKIAQNAPTTASPSETATPEMGQ